MDAALAKAKLSQYAAPLAARGVGSLEQLRALPAAQAEALLQALLEKSDTGEPKKAHRRAFAKLLAGGTVTPASSPASSRLGSVDSSFDSTASSRASFSEEKRAELEQRLSTERTEREALQVSLESMRRENREREDALRAKIDAARTASATAAEAVTAAASSAEQAARSAEEERDQGSAASAASERERALREQLDQNDEERKLLRQQALEAVERDVLREAQIQQAELAVRRLEEEAESMRQWSQSEVAAIKRTQAELKGTVAKLSASYGELFVVKRSSLSGRDGPGQATGQATGQAGAEVRLQEGIRGLEADSNRLVKESSAQLVALDADIMALEAQAGDEHKAESARVRRNVCGALQRKLDDLATEFQAVRADAQRRHADAEARAIDEAAARQRAAEIMARAAQRAEERKLRRQQVVHEKSAARTAREAAWDAQDKVMRKKAAALPALEAAIAALGPPEPVRVGEWENARARDGEYVPVPLLDALKAMLMTPSGPSAKVFGASGHCGAGKTAMLLEIAADPAVRAWFTGGVFLVRVYEFELREARQEAEDEAGRLSLCASQFQLLAAAGAKPASLLFEGVDGGQSSLVSTFSERRALFLLDAVGDCTQKQLRSLMFADKAPMCRWLVASRSASFLEQLGIPGPARLTLRSLHPAKAQELLVLGRDRVATALVAMQGGGVFAEAVASAELAELLAACAGVPSAILLAAALAATLSGGGDCWRLALLQVQQQQAHLADAEDQAEEAAHLLTSALEPTNSASTATSVVKQAPASANTPSKNRLGQGDESSGGEWLMDSVYPVIAAAFEQLDASVQQRWCELAVFPPGMQVPLSVLRKLWDHQGMDNFATRHLLSFLQLRGFVTCSVTPQDLEAGVSLGQSKLVDDNVAVAMPALLHAFLRLRQERSGHELRSFGESPLSDVIEEAHRKLSMDWLEGGLLAFGAPKAQMYILRHLTWHLDGARWQPHALKAIWRTDYLEARLLGLGMFAVIAQLLRAAARSDGALSASAPVENRALRRGGGDRWVQCSLSLPPPPALQWGRGSPDEVHAELLMQMLWLALPVLVLHPREFRQQLLCRLAECRDPPMVKLLHSAAFRSPRRVPDFLPLVPCLPAPSAAPASGEALDEVRRGRASPIGSIRSSFQATLSILAVGIDATGAVVVTCSADGAVSKWVLDSPSGLVVKVELSGHTGIAQGVSVSGDGKRAATFADDGTVIYDLTTNTVLRRLSRDEHSGMVCGVALDFTGNTIVTCAGDGRVLLWDGASNKRHELLGHSRWVVAVSVSADGTTAASCSKTEVIQWDLREMRGTTLPDLGASVVHLLPQVDNGGDDEEQDGIEIMGLDLAPDGSTLAINCTVGVVLWELAQQAPQRIVSRAHHEEQIWCISASDRGVLSCSDDGAVVLCSLSGELVASFHTGTDSVNAVATSADAGLSVCGMASGGIAFLWQMRSLWDVPPPAFMIVDKMRQDVDAAGCELCAKAWSIKNRRHHCRRCGCLACGDCSNVGVKLNPEESAAALKARGDGVLKIDTAPRSEDSSASQRLRGGHKAAATQPEAAVTPTSSAEGGPDAEAGVAAEVLDTVARTSSAVGKIVGNTQLAKDYFFKKLRICAACEAEASAVEAEQREVDEELEARSVPVIEGEYDYEEADL